MAKNDELDSLLKSALLKSEDREFLQTAMSLTESKDAQAMNIYIRHECYGHSLANVFRNQWEPDYLTIVRDVAKKLKIVVRDHQTVTELEDRILIELLENLKEATIKKEGQAAWDKLEKEAEAELRSAVAGGKQADHLKGVKPGTLFAFIVAGRLSGIWVYLMANKLFFAIARKMGWSVGVALAGPIIGRTLSFLLGPAGWILTAAWLVWDLLDTNWKKTIVVVTAIALLRRKIEWDQLSGDGDATPTSGK